MKKFLLVCMMVFLLSACSSQGKGITIEPYSLSDQEQQLVSQTGVDMIEYFKLNGSLDELDLNLSIEVYEDGELKEEILQMYGMLEETFKDEFVSFVLSKYDVSEDDGMFDLKINSPGGSIGGGAYPSIDGASTYGLLLEEKITLEKDVPTYLAAWAGTTKDTLSTLHTEKGQLPENIDQYEQALLFKIVLTDASEE